MTIQSMYHMITFRITYRQSNPNLKQRDI